MNDLAVLVCTHAFVACSAWANGFLVGAALGRRRDEVEAWLPPLFFVDLTEPAAAYDWAVDGEATEVRP